MSRPTGRAARTGAQIPESAGRGQSDFYPAGVGLDLGGVTAGIDLCLALVEEDLGRAVALEVARHLVVFLKRPGGQSQFSVTLSLQKGGSRFSELHAWIAEHLHLDLNIPTLAAACGMSERSFVRHYRAETGQTPARAVELIRVETARRQLADSAVAIKRIAAQCGFGSEETMRRSFLRALSITRRFTASGFRRRLESAQCSCDSSDQVRRPHTRRSRHASRVRG